MYTENNLIMDKDFAKKLYSKSKRSVSELVHKKNLVTLPSSWKEKMIAVVMIENILKEYPEEDRAIAILHAMPQMMKFKFWGALEEYYK